MISTPTNFSHTQKVLWLSWFGLLLVGSFLFVFRIAHESVWMDEAFSIAVADHPLGEIWRLTAEDCHPPLYYFMLRAFRLIFGDSILASRLFSAVGAFCLVLLGIGPIRRVCGNKVALIYTLLAIVMPILVAHAQEIRMYSWAAFFVTGMAVYTCLAIYEGKRSNWIALGLFTIAAMYTHVYSLFAAFFIGLFALVRLLVKDRRKLPAFLIAVGIPILLFIPWLFALLQQASRFSRDYWIPEAGIRVVIGALVYPFGLKWCTFGLIWYSFKWLGSLCPGYWLHYIIAAVAFLAIVGGAVIASLRRRRNLLLPVLSLFAFFATLLTGVLLNKLIRPLFWPRYTAPLLGLLLIAMAYGISQLNKWLTVIICVLLVLSQASVLSFIYWNRFEGPMREVVEYLEDNMGKDDVFVHLDEFTLHTFAFYLPDHPHVMYLKPGSPVYSNLKVHGSIVRIVSDLSGVSQENRGVWIALRSGSLNNRFYDEAVKELGGEPAFVGPVPQALHEAAGAGGVQFFQTRYSWYAVILQRVESSP